MPTPKIVIGSGDISAEATPAVNTFIVMVDTDGVLKKKDSSDNIVDLEGGAGSSTGIIKIAELLGADMNTTADQALTFISGTAFILTDIVITNSSTDLNTADDGQFWTGTSRTGVDVADTSTGGGQGIQKLTGSTRFINIGSNGANDINLNGYNDLLTELYFSLGTPQGSAATADIYVYGYKLA